MVRKLTFLFGALQAALASPINVVPEFNSTDTSSHHSLSARGPGGVVVFGNRCYYDVWLWSVSQAVRLLPHISPPSFPLSNRTILTLSL